MLLAVTDPAAAAAPRDDGLHRREGRRRSPSMPGLTIPPPLKKLGYKGIESTELVFDGFRVAPSTCSAARPGRPGFKQFMAGIELGRVNIAARGLGSRRPPSSVDPLRAGARGLRRADRPAPADPAKLAPMATKIRAAELLDARCRADEGLRRARRPRGRDGEALCHRDRRGGGARGDADPRRLRVLDEFPSSGSTATPAADPRRGLERDPAAVIARRLLERHKLT